MLRKIKINSTNNTHSRYLLLLFDIFYLWGVERPKEKKYRIESSEIHCYFLKSGYFLRVLYFYSLLFNKSRILLPKRTTVETRAANERAQ